MNTQATEISLANTLRKTVFLKKADEEEKEKLLLHLALLGDEGKMQFFLERLSSPEAPAKRSGKLRIYTKDAFYFLRFTIAPVGADDILQFARLKRTRKNSCFVPKSTKTPFALPSVFK